MTNKGKGRGIVKIPSELPGEEVVLHSYDLESKAGDGKGDAKEEAQNRNESKVGFAKTDNLTSNTFGTQGLQRKTSQNKERVITTADQVSFKPNGPAAERIPEITPQSKGISFTTPIQSFKQQQLPKQSLPATEIFKGQIKGALENVKELDRKDLQAAYALGMGAQQTPSLVDSRKNLGSPVGRTAIAPGLSEMEVKFQSEIIKVKEMSGVIENLMSYIEGKGSLKKGERQLSFTRTHVEAIEHTTQKLFKECQTLREEMQEQRCNIMDLRDEVLQVDSWRMYVQSIIEQLFDERYQELCNKQTLHPELAGMRKRILQADQSLKQQIAELEEHLHNLELYEWQKKKQLNMKAVTSERLSRSMQGIYETINTQMEVAQQLSRRITLQSQALKLPVIPKEELESMLSNLKMQDMASQERPVVRTRGRLSSSGPLDFSPANRTVKSSLQTPSKQLISTGVRAGLQDSTRRRRDSVDKFWVDVGAAKTTVKRATPVKRFDALSSISKDTLKSEPITSRKEALYSPEGLYSRTGARQVKTDMSVFGSGHVEKYSREVMANAQSERMSSAQPDKLMAMGGGFTAAQPLQQKMAQMESPTTVSASWGPVVTTDTLQSNVQAYAPTGPQSMPKTRSEKKPSKSFGEEIDKALPASVICEGASVSNLSFTKAVAHSQQTAAVSDLEGGPTVAVLSVPPRITEIQRTETSRAQVHPSQAFEIKKPEFQISKTDTSINERTSAFPSFGLASVLKSSSNSNSTFAISMSSSEQGTGQMTSMPKPSEVCDTPLSSPPNIVQSVSSMPICQTLSFSSSETASSLAFPAHAPGSTLFTSVPQNNNISSTQSSVLLSSAAGVIAQASSPALNVSSQSAVKVQDSSNDSDEEEMEEEANNATVFGSSSFTGFGLGSTPPVTSQRSTPFGLGSSFSPTESSPFGGASVWNQQSSSTLSGSPGQLFKPASFSIPAAPVTTTPSSSSPFGQTVTSANAGQSGFGTVGLITPQVTSGGQQALGSALGSFGQTRQIGSPFGTPSASGFGFTTGAGFANTASSAGFSSAATGGGFASIAASGGFANIASGSGFAGFAGGAAGNSSPSPNQGGFGAFSGGAFSAFGGHTNPSLFTQMRK
ncbi:hypothetical protein KP509_34G009300 [Ceratopteris richardii]|uniref:Nuclear pore complex protein n=1 Tax=Ceratopteris richardii TaxID=49495 RepID=A0A8T2QHW4_CERRI|nr:hypothetical protein KP509_34G009300 [Ceratopteris richardii]